MNIYLSGKICQNKEEGDHSNSTPGEDAIMTRKMAEELANFVHLIGFLFQRPDSEGFQHR